LRLVGLMGGYVFLHVLFPHNKLLFYELAAQYTRLILGKDYSHFNIKQEAL